MREILFRGKRIDNGEWVCGSLSLEYLQECGCVMISPSSDDCYKVYPETVGQFTGLTDKNGKRIFEGDIVKTMSSGAVGVVAFGTGTFDSGIYCYTGWNLKDKYGNVDHNELFVYGDEPYYGFEVIGNIHDNPELMEGREGE